MWRYGVLHSVANSLGHCSKVSGKETMLNYVEIVTVLQSGCYKLSENIVYLDKHIRYFVLKLLVRK